MVALRKVNAIWYENEKYEKIEIVDKKIENFLWLKL